MPETISDRMQESLYQTADARDSVSDSRCKQLYRRQRMQETISDSGCWSLYIKQTISDSRCKRLYQTADAGCRVSISDSGKRLYHTAVARDSISDSGDYIRQRISISSGSISDSGEEFYIKRRISISDSKRLYQQVQETLYQTAGCQRQETLYQRTVSDASNSIEDSGCRRHQTADAGDSGCKRL